MILISIVKNIWPIKLTGTSDTEPDTIAVTLLVAPNSLWTASIVACVNGIGTLSPDADNANKLSMDKDVISPMGLPALFLNENENVPLTIPVSGKNSLIENSSLETVYPERLLMLSATSWLSVASNENSSEKVVGPSAGRFTG